MDPLVNIISGELMSKPKIVLFAAFKTTGFLLCKELWIRRDNCDLVIMVLTTEKKSDLFKKI